MLEKYTFMSKILFTQNFIHALWFKWFQAIYIFLVFQNLSLCHTYILYWRYAKIRGISIFWQFLKFLELSRQFSQDVSGLFPRHIRLAEHVRLRARTCPSLSFPAYIRGLSAPLRTLSLFLFHTITCGGQGLSRWFWVFSTESLWFLGDLTPLLLRIIKP
jgi:hypothetical protein